MRILLPSVIAIVAGVWSDALPAQAQAPVCPYGYYYASDGRCYPGSPPVYQPPVYEAAPPVYQPPAVFDGFALGIGLGALIDGFGHDQDRREPRRGGERRDERRGGNVRR